jgi:hypothetical protein
VIAGAMFALALGDPRLDRMEPGVFVTGSSDLGWPPGWWPEKVEILTDGMKKVVLVGVETIRDAGGEFAGVRYAAAHMSLTVWND